MIALKCKMCGGDLYPQENTSTCECEFCGTLQTIPSVDDEKKLALFGRAQRLLFACEYDKASGVYESIVADFPTEAEAYWGLVLCKYGIEYVDDPGTGKKIPTCHRTSFDSVFDDSNFEQATENADPVARRVYRDEAKSIEELRKGIIEVSGKEEPYDVFICYKETDENGNRTLDSVLAQDIYNELIDNGYRVFFSRITLEDKLGQEYEPYIFAALNSARIMLAVGTDYEYYNSVWVKNEWSRFLKLISSGEKKILIPCYKNIDAYDMPKEFSKLQAQDMGKVGAMQDLMRGLKKIYNPKENATKTKTIDPHIAILLEKANLSLEESNWIKAKEYFDQVLDSEPKVAEAYLGLLMCELEVNTWEKLTEKYVESQSTLRENVNFVRARRFASGELDTKFKKLDAFVQQQKEKLEEEWKQERNIILSQAEQLVTTEGVMVAEESMTVDTQVEIVPGVVLQQGFVSPYMVTEDDTQEAVIDNPLVLLCNEEIKGIQSILPVLEQVVQAGKTLLIICPKIDQECLSTLVINKQRETFTSVTVIVASEGRKPNGIYEDIAVCTGATVYYNSIGFSMTDITIEMLGSAKKVIVSKDYTIILSNQEDEVKIEGRINDLSKAIKETTDELQKEEFESRKNAISQKIALIRIGGDKEEDIKEKTHRLKKHLAERRRESMGSVISEEQRAEIWKELESRLLDEAEQGSGVESIILVEESKRIDSFVINAKGLRFPQGYISSYMITDSDKQEAVLDNALVLISNKTITTIQQILPILEQVVQTGKPLLIIAPDYTREPADTLSINAKRGTMKAAVVKAPGSALQKEEYLRDIAILTGAIIVSGEGNKPWTDVTIDQLGRADKVIVTKKNTIVVESNNILEEQWEQEIDARTEQLKNQVLNAQREEKKELYERYSKLKCGISIIEIGGDSEQDIKERLKSITTIVENKTKALEEKYSLRLEECLVSDETRWTEKIKAQEEKKRIEAQEKEERARRQAREKEEKARRETELRAEQERQRREQELIKRRSALQREKNELQLELSNLRGLFVGSKRQRIERRLTEIEAALRRLNG